MEFLLVYWFFGSIFCWVMTIEIARRKGMSTASWGLAGFFFGILAMIAAGLMPANALPSPVQVLPGPDTTGTRPVPPAQPKAPFAERDLEQTAAALLRDAPWSSSRRGQWLVQQLDASVASGQLSASDRATVERLIGIMESR